jgi:hypothetical protein
MLASSPMRPAIAVSAMPSNGMVMFETMFGSAKRRISRSVGVNFKVIGGSRQLAY